MASLDKDTPYEPTKTMTTVIRARALVPKKSEMKLKLTSRFLPVLHHNLARWS
jgi:hypothetical protein